MPEVLIWSILEVVWWRREILDLLSSFEIYSSFYFGNGKLLGWGSYVAPARFIAYLVRGVCFYLAGLQYDLFRARNYYWPAWLYIVLDIPLLKLVWSTLDNVSTFWMSIQGFSVAFSISGFGFIILKAFL